MQHAMDAPWHNLPEPTVVDSLGVDPERGLDAAEVEQRRGQFGPNAITLKKGRSPFVLFLLQFNQPLVYILLLAAVVTGFLREWVDSGVIFGVVLVNAIIGFIQEAKAVKAIEALARSLSSSATVLRGGERRQIPAEELVPGDIVLLQSGDKVPADLRLLRLRELQIDESALTGESVPVQKQAEPLPADDTSWPTAPTWPTPRPWSPTESAPASWLPPATGREIGRINELIASADILATPLTRKIARFSALLLYVILGLAVITFSSVSCGANPGSRCSWRRLPWRWGPFPRGCRRR